MKCGGTHLRYGGYIFVVYFWILAAALVSGVLIMLTHTSQVFKQYILHIEIVILTPLHSSQPQQTS